MLKKILLFLTLILIPTTILAAPPASRVFLFKFRPQAEEKVTVVKYLTPIARGANSDFNQYALGEKDVIQVNIEISGLLAGSQIGSIKDELLSVKNPAVNLRCTPSLYNPSSGALSNVGTAVTWTNITSASSTLSLSYRCTMPDSPDYNKTAEPMVGNTEVSYDGKMHYGGFMGSEIVYNYNKATGQTISADENYTKDQTLSDNGRGYDYFGYNVGYLSSCIGGILAGVSKSTCFIRNNISSTYKAVSSRTYVNTVASNEISVLFNPKVLISGDVYLGGSNLDDFSYWGRNLAQTKGDGSDSSAFIGVGGYTLNPESQSVFSGSQAEDYFSKVDRLNGEGKTAPTIPNPSQLYLQGSNLVSLGADETEIYPDGKVWTISGDTSLNGATYRGVGTIIVDGDLTISSGSTINPFNQSSRLGIIVTGNLTIGSNCKIRAAILSLNNIDFGSNNEMTGSFVARTFSNLLDVNVNSNKFFYDYNFDNSWPPGFRYLDMPQAKQ